MKTVDAATGAVTGSVIEIPGSGIAPQMAEVLGREVAGPTGATGPAGTSSGVTVRAVSPLPLPYAFPLVFDPTQPAASIVFPESVDVGDTLVIQSYVEISNQNAAPRDVQLEILLDDVVQQDSSISAIAPDPAVGSLLQWPMSIALPIAAPSATPTIKLIGKASGADVIGSQVFLMVTKYPA